MVPERGLVALLVELAEEVWAVLGRDVERDLGEVEVGPDAAACGDARAGEDVGTDALAQLARRAPVEREVVGDVHEHLVDGVHVDVLRCEVGEVDAVDIRRTLDVERHARRGHDVVDVGWDLEDAAAVAHTERLHGGRDGKADGLVAALGIGHHEPRGHGVEAALDALHAGVEALEVDAEVLSVAGGHRAVSPSRRPSRAHRPPRRPDRRPRWRARNRARCPCRAR